MFRKALPGLVALSLACATTASAQVTVLSGDHSVDGHLCVGEACTGTESFGNFPLKLKDTVVGIQFDDTSTQAGEPTHDWRLLVNDTLPFGQPSISIQDGQTGLQVFKIEAYARANAFYVDDGNSVGFGTSMPQAHLHVQDGDTPTLRLEQDGTGGWDPQVWEVSGNDLDFRISDLTAGVHAFSIKHGNNNNAVAIDGIGRVGFGTSLPNTQMHMYGEAGTAQFLVEETNATTTPRTLLNLQNNGRPEIVMGNSGTGGEWSFGAGTNFVLKQGAVGTASSAKTKHLTLYSATGDLEITGQIVTGGPTCSAGCDAVFSPGYDLPSIAEHARDMFALGHLPNVGPTEPGRPVNMSEQYGRLLNELEHAHIFIARQNDLILSQSDAIAHLAARVDALETRD